MTVIKRPSRCPRCGSTASVREIREPSLADPADKADLAVTHLEKDANCPDYIEDITPSRR
ncbi:hypothetical protein [Demequina sp. SO4-18]|uniref:hypothetical protein n=1 Tax=Demequina sp. SO4-18 TaxID=3401026 RepID=UPI003B59AD28